MTILTAQETFRMLANATLWDEAHRVHECLTQAGIPHAMVGGVAVCLHGYRRNTVDLDWLINPLNCDVARVELESAGLTFHPDRKEFTAPSGIAVQFVMSGEKEGPGQSATFPDPADPRSVTVIEGLPVLTLRELLQSKLACGLGNLRRTHKDFADVVELIAIHRLTKAFARQLHKSVRDEFKALVDQARA
jgi:hypothetical protein